jgi:hypothetical protein
VPPNALRTPIAFFALVCAGSSAHAKSFDFPSHRFGLSVGNSSQYTGLRLNFRDAGVRSVSGINLTLWRPYDADPASRITGINVGVLPGGRTQRGLQVGLAGLEAHDVAGVTLASLGVGIGGNADGLQISGLALAVAGAARGVGIAGIGLAGDDLYGIHVAGVGLASGHRMVGVHAAGLGLGGGGDAYGINVAGIGVGMGHGLVGINVAGIGLGAGGRITGINVAGLGVGAGERVEGITVAGLGVGGLDVRGLAVAGLAIGGQQVTGVAVAGASVSTAPDGNLNGVAVSPVNWVRGTQRGLSIGLFNYARRLLGVQLGVINIVRDHPAAARALPIMNVGF